MIRYKRLPILNETVDLYHKARIRFVNDNPATAPTADKVIKAALKTYLQKRKGAKQ
jgi:hypothetical protein